MPVTMITRVKSPYETDNTLLYAFLAASSLTVSFIVFIGLSIMSGTEFKVGDIVATVVIVLSLVLAVGIAVLCRCHNKNKKKNKQIILNRDAAYIPVSKIMGSNCGVCLDSKDSRMGQVVKLHCNHTFHSECMAESLKRQTKCPLCRRRVKPFTPAQRIIAYIENKISQMRLTYNSEQVVESNV